MEKLIIILLLFTNLPARAQNGFITQYYFGVNSGLNIAGLNTTSTIDEKYDASISSNNRYGYGGGVVFLCYSESRKGIQMELNYSQRGWKEDSDTINYTRKLEYIEFPFLSHLDFKVKNLNISVTVGPTVSYLISSQEKTSTTDENKMKSYYNKQINNEREGGLCMGLGVNKYISNGIIQTEFRFNQALSNIFSDKDIGLSQSQNQAISMKVSYLFKL